MTTLLPQDSNDNPIPALRLKQNGAQKITVGASSARNSTAFDEQTRIVGLYSDVPVYINCGDASAVATTSDHYLPANMYYDISIGGDSSAHYTHISVIQESSAGTLYISEKE